MIFGSYIGAQQDAFVTAWGLFWNFANVLFTTGYQLYMKMVLNEEKKRLGRWGPVYYNNLLALPPLLIPTVYHTQGWSVAIVDSNGISPSSATHAHTHTYIHTENAKVWLVLMMFVGAVMTMASFWCMRMTSPTTYSVVGALNKVPLAIISMYVFDQYPTAYGAYGIAIGMVHNTSACTHMHPQQLSAEDFSTPLSTSVQTRRCRRRRKGRLPLRGTLRTRPEQARRENENNDMH